MRRLGEDVVHRAGLDDLAGVHDGDPVGDLVDHAEVVGDEDQAHAGVALQVLEQVHDLRLHGDVEGGRRLVGDEDARVQRQRHRDHDALAHAAGELVRVVVDPPRRGRDAHAVHELDGVLLGLLLGGAAVRPEHLADLEADAVDRVQRRQRVLEDHRDARAADLPLVLGVHRQHVAALEPDAAAGDHRRRDVQDAHDRLRRDRLARPRLPEDRQGLALVDGVADAVDRVDDAGARAELDVQVVDLEHRAGARVVGGRGGEEEMEPLLVLTNAASGRGRRAGRRPS